MDAIFHEVSGAKGWFDVVKVAKNRPYRYGKNGEVLIDYEETSEAQEGRRRSSVNRPGSMDDPEKPRFTGVTNTYSNNSKDD